MKLCGALSWLLDFYISGPEKVNRTELRRAQTPVISRDVLGPCRDAESLEKPGMFDFKKDLTLEPKETGKLGERN